MAREDRLDSLRRRWEASRSPTTARSLAAELAARGALTLEWISRIGPEAARVAAERDPRAVERAVLLLASGTWPGAVGLTAAAFVMHPDEWFPDHEALDVCPRGHPFDATANERGPNAFAVDYMDLRYSGFVVRIGSDGAAEVDADWGESYGSDEPLDRKELDDDPARDGRTALLCCNAFMGARSPGGPDWIEAGAYRPRGEPVWWFPPDTRGRTADGGRLLEWRTCLARWRVRDALVRIR